MFQAFLARLLSPLSYRTRPDTGAGGATVTGCFIGDLALDYAIHYARYGGENLWDGRTWTMPRYKEDLQVMRHRCTVAVPNGQVTLMPMEYQATSFVSDGFPNVQALKSTGSSSMKNWMQKQCIAPFEEFHFVVLSKDEKLPPRMTIRVGNGRETLVELTEEELPESSTLNAFTAAQVLERKMPAGRSVQMENARYILVHGIPLNSVEECLRW
jgi:CRISPR type I-D-associated protein Csc1